MMRRVEVRLDPTQTWALRHVRTIGLRSIIDAIAIGAVIAAAFTIIFSPRRNT